MHKLVRPRRGAPPDRLPLSGIRTSFRRLTARAARMIRAEAAALARKLRADGYRGEALAAIVDGRRRATAMAEITPYTIRHTVASELRRRGVSVWDVAGLLGHSSGYKTTERYAKFGPDHLAGCVRAIDAYFADLRAVLGALPSDVAVEPLRVSCVLENGRRLVEPRGIEPLTSTMPL